MFRQTLHVIFIFFLAQRLEAENRFNFNLSTAETTTYNSTTNQYETDTLVFVSAEGFISMDRLNTSHSMQGPVLTLFDITNSDDSLSDYFFLGWQLIYEHRENIEVVLSAYSIFERSFYNKYNGQKQFTLASTQGYGGRLAIKVYLFDDVSMDLARAEFEVSPDGTRSYSYDENSISLSWLF